MFYFKVANFISPHMFMLWEDVEQTFNSYTKDEYFKKLNDGYNNFEYTSHLISMYKVLDTLSDI